MRKGMLSIAMTILCLTLSACSMTTPAETSSAEVNETSQPVTAESTGVSVSPDESDVPGPEAPEIVSEETDNQRFDFETRTVTLNSGYEMPILGLGMFSLSNDQTENSTYWALKAGFRLIEIH